MKHKKEKAVVWAVLLLSFLVSGCDAGNDRSRMSEQITFPADYRNWRHVKTEVWGEGHPLYEDVGGIHHIYANELAAAGYEIGVFADGSVLVFDLLDFEVSDGATIEGPRKALFLMVRDEQRYPETGGWGFDGFDTNNEIMGIATTTAKTACFACHTSSKDTQYVVSTYRE